MENLDHLKNRKINNCIEIVLEKQNCFSSLALSRFPSFFLSAIITLLRNRNAMPFLSSFIHSYTSFNGSHNTKTKVNLCSLLFLICYSTSTEATGNERKWHDLEGNLQRRTLLKSELEKVFFFFVFVLFLVACS